MKVHIFDLRSLSLVDNNLNDKVNERLLTESKEEICYLSYEANGTISKKVLEINVNRERNFLVC